MSYVLSSLGDYTKQNADKLLTGVVMKSVTAERIKAKGNIMTDIKTSEKIGLIDTGATYQDGTNCGFNAVGNTTITQREIVVKPIKVNEEFCERDLEAKFTQLALPAGDEYDTLTFEQEIVEKKIAVINYQNEVAIWKGDTGSGVHYLNKLDGFLKLLAADPTVQSFNFAKGAGTISAGTGDPTVTGVGTSFTTTVSVGDKVYAGTTLLGVVDSVTNNTSLELTANAAAAAFGLAFGYVPSESPFFSAPITAAISTSTIRDILNAIYLAIPEALMASAEAPVVYMGTDLTRILKVALISANLYHYKPEGDPMDPFTIPGLDLECQPTPGLTGTNTIVVARDSNLFLGTDLAGDENNVKLWYDEDTELVKLKVRWKMGVNYAFGNEIGVFRLVA